jgi:signal transduction histidine kinase
MEEKQISPLSSRSFSLYLLLLMVALVIFIVGLMSVNGYRYATVHFDREYSVLGVQTEKNVEEAFRLTDSATNLLDDRLNNEMEGGLLTASQEYEHAGGDISRMNLSGIQAGLGPGYDIYVIDENGVIVRTTYAPELGQDFRKVPYFYNYLMKIRNSSGFFPDRVVHEFLGSGQYRKYAYMPTADHRYVIEIGLGGAAFDQANRVLDNNQNINNMVMTNPYVESFVVFNSMGRRVDNNSVPAEPVAGYLRQVLDSRNDLEIIDSQHLRTIHFLFIDMKDTRYGSDTSRIVMITYNRQGVQDALNRLLLNFIIFAIMAIAIGSLLAFFLSRRMNRPIQTIVADVDIIARGGLDHRIGEMQSHEFAVLAQSINTMVDSLKSAFQRMKDDEIFKTEMIDQLPVAVFIKRADNGRYVYWNTTCEQLYQIPQSQVIGRTDQDLFPADMVEAIKKENIDLFLNRGEVRNRIISNKHLGGRVLHTIIVPVFDSTGNPQYVLGISEDVSHQGINLKMDLLFSITRHDILDNLSVIMNHLERAQLMHSPSEMQQFFEKTIGSIESIRNQIVYMRALQELGLVSPKWQQLGQVFDDAVRLLPEHKAAIRADVDGVEIFADPLLPRVFYNILENSLRNGTRAHQQIGLSIQPDGDDLLVLYTDNGYWIPEEEKEMIYDIGNDRGTIRGLFLIRELLAFTGITIRETGLAGTGVRFEIRVPPGKFRYNR